MAAKKIVNPTVAIVGATGAVGVELIHCLEQRNFPLSELRLFASARSAGKSLKFRGKKIKVKELTEKSFDGVQIGLFSAGSSTTKKFAKAAVAAGTIIIDNSSAYRMDPDMPLVWVLRDLLELTGTKFGCGQALCGACTVHLDDEVVRSCVTPVSRAAGKSVTTQTNSTEPRATA